MKKGLLVLAAASILCAGNAMADTWGVIGEFSSWSDDVEMSEVSEGVYTVTMESLEGDFKFRANHDWSVNFGADYVANISGNASDIPMKWNGDNFSTVGTLSDVTLTIDVNNYTLEVSGLPSDMEVPAPPVQDPVLYLIGDPVGIWAPDYGVEMNSLGGGVYSWYGRIEAPAWFAFATELSEDWAVLNAHRFGPSEDGQLVPIGTEVSMEYPKEAAWKVEKTGDYKFTVNTTDFTFSASATFMDELPWGVIGSFNGWTDDAPMTEVGEGIYSITIESLAKGEEFKFRANRDWAINLGASGDGVIFGDGEYGLADSGYNLMAGIDFVNVTLTINVNDFTLTVSGLGTEGINAVAADDDAPVFYNLQGMPVQNPKNGVFIRVANGKTTKIVL